MVQGGETVALFGRRESAQAVAVAEPPPAIRKPEPPPPARKEPEDDFCLPLDPEPPGTPRQRGRIGEERAAVMRLQLQVADNLRQKLLAPDVPLDLPLERTPGGERTLFGALNQLVSSNRIRLPPTLDKNQFFQGVADEAFGLGPIQPLVDRDDITEIMVNGPYVIFIEKKGKLRESGFKFLDDDHVERIIKRIVLPLGRTASSDHPLIDARLPDGSRGHSRTSRSRSVDKTFTRATNSPLNSGAPGSACSVNCFTWT